MTFKTLLLASASVAMIAGAASANPVQDINLSYGYQTFENDTTGKTSDSNWVKASSDFELGAFDSALGLTLASIDDDSKRMTLNTKLQKDLGDVTAGGFLDFTHSDDPADNTYAHIGMAADYDMGTFDVAAFAGFGRYTTNPGSPKDSKVYGVAANFDLPLAFDAGAFFKTEEMDANDYTEKGLSVGYDLSGFGAPLYVAMAVTKVEVEGQNAKEGTKAGLSVTVPLGGKLATGVKQAHAHSARSNDTFLTTF